MTPRHSITPHAAPHHRPQLPASRFAAASDVALPLAYHILSCSACPFVHSTRQGGATENASALIITRHHCAAPGGTGVAMAAAA